MKRFLLLLAGGAAAFVLSIVLVVTGPVPGAVDPGPIVNQEPAPAWSNEDAANAFAPVVRDHPSISAIDVDGRYMRVHLNERLSTAVCREMASMIAQRYSQYRISKGVTSGVTVTAVYDGMVMAEVDARNTRITAVR